MATKHTDSYQVTVTKHTLTLNDMEFDLLRYALAHLADAEDVNCNAADDLLEDILY